MIVPGRHRCRGLATLFMVSVMLLIAALASWSLARALMTEQRLIANDRLATEALLAAQSGLAIACVKAGTITLPTGESPVEPLLEQTVDLDEGLSVQWSLMPLPAEGLFEITATGFAGNGRGARTVRQLLRRAPWLPVPPAQAVTVREPSGHEAEAFFAVHFGRPPPVMHRLSTVIDCTPCAPGELTADPARPWWLTGEGQHLASGVYGTPEAPLLLIVDGDLQLSGDVTVHGVVHIRGNVVGPSDTGAGTLTIDGGLLIEGETPLPAAVTVTHVPEAIATLQASGPLARVAGSWRDF